MKYVEYPKDKLVVTVERELKPGMRFSISPSSMWNSISDDVVTILNIVHMDELYGDEQNKFYSFYMDCIEGNVSDEVFEQEKDRLENGYWVAFTYSRGGHIGVLPLEEFVNHTSVYAFYEGV